MNRPISSFLLGGILTFVSTAHAQSVETLWTARGIQAQGRLEKLEAASKKGKLSQQELCSRILEEGFARFASEKRTSFMKVSSDDRTGYLLHFHDGPEGMIIVFSYDAKEKQPLSLMPVSIGDDYQFVMMTDHTGVFGVRSSKCVYIFKPTNYFEPSVSTMK